ncbi:hypothetical protein A6S26_01005 [Nostoc sp. ATCC 43529]|nr:hypothetical protein A6S26_01005 [Nostoc sp. ATCC 43529]
MLGKTYKNKIALFTKKGRKSLFWLYQLKSKLFATAFGHVAIMVSGYKNERGSNSTAKSSGSSLPNPKF